VSKFFDMSLLIIAHLYLLRAIDSFNHSSRLASATKIVRPQEFTTETQSQV
jgi:hypothetical protein